MNTEWFDAAMDLVVGANEKWVFSLYEVATILDVSKPVVKKYFPDKADMLVAQYRTKRKQKSKRVKGKSPHSADTQQRSKVDFDLQPLQRNSGRYINPEWLHTAIDWAIGESDDGLPSVAAVCRMIGVSRSVIEHHFPNKAKEISRAYRDNKATQFIQRKAENAKRIKEIVVALHESGESVSSKSVQRISGLDFRSPEVAKAYREITEKINSMSDGER